MKEALSLRTVLFALAFVAPSFFVLARSREAPAEPPAPLTPEDAGNRAIEQAMRWIARGKEPIATIQTIHANVEYRFDDGTTREQRPAELWFRNPNALRANFEYGGRATTCLLVDDRAWMIRDRIRITSLNDHAGLGFLVPALRDARSWLTDFARALAPKGVGAGFRMEGVLLNLAATGGRWLEVVRTAPGEPKMTYLLGTALGPDGTLHALAPDRVIVHSQRAPDRRGFEYRLAGWDREDLASRAETIRYPRDVRMYAIRVDPEDAPRLRVVVSSLEVNVYVDPGLLVQAPVQAPVQDPPTKPK